MKKIMYLFLVGTIFLFPACNASFSDISVENSAENVGCKAEGGVCLTDHSCCIIKE